MAEGGIGSVSVSVVPDATDFWRRFRAQTSGQATEEGRRAGEDWHRGFNTGAGHPEVTVRVNTNKAQQDTLSLKNALIGLAPAAVPLAGAAGLAGAAFISLGVAGVFAIKGIEAEMKKGTKAGTDYAAIVAQIKSTTSSLQSTVARGILPGAEQAMQKLQQALPALNADLGNSATVLGSITNHLVGGLVGGLHTFAPAIAEVEGGVNRLAARFEAWATGPGGAKFAQSLTTDLQHVAPLLENLTQTVARFVAGANVSGLGIIDELNVLSAVLKHIPPDAWAVLSTGIVSLKIAGLVSGLMDKLALSIGDVAVAEAGAAAASGGFRGGLASTVGFLGKAAAAWIGLSIATSSAKDATSGWQSSTNDVKRFFGTFTTGLSDITHLNFKGAWSDLFGSGADQAAKAAGYVKTLHSALDDMYASFGKRQQSTILDLQHSTIGSVGSVAGDKTSPTVEQQIQKSYKATLDATTQAMGRQQQALGLLAGHATLSQLQTAYGASATAMQKNIDTTEKFLKVGGEEAYVYKGVTVTSGMYAIALQKTGGNLEAATGFIHAQIDALSMQKSALALNGVEQQRLGTFVSDVSTKYKLTSDQVDLYTEAMGLNANKIAGSTAGLKNAEIAFGRLIHTLSNGSTALNGWLAAVDAWKKSADTAADRAQLIGAALVAANGDMLSYANTMASAATANQQLVTDFKNLHSGILDLKTGALDFHNAGAAPVLSDLANLQTAAMNSAAAVYQHYNAVGDASAADKAFSTYVSDTRGALIGQATQLGLTHGQAKKLADQYFSIKNAGDLKKQISLIGDNKVLSALRGILSDLDILAGKHVTSYVDIIASIDSRVAGVQGTKGSDPRLAADGMIVTQGTGPRADDVLVRVSKGEAIIPADQTSKHMGLVKSLIGRTQGFAGGGVVGDPSNPFTGVDYSGKANKNGVRKGSSKSGSSPKTTYTVAGQGYASLLAAENAAKRLFKADVTLGVKIDDKDLTGFRAALKGTVDQARTAFNTLYADAKKIGISKKLAASLQAENKLLDAAIDDRNKSVDKLKTVMGEFKQVHDSVQQAGQGGFDVTSAGTGFNGQQAVTFGNLQAQETQAKNLVTKWSAAIRTLQARFGKSPTGKAMIEKLAEGSPTDYPQVAALLSANPKDLANFVAGQKAIDDTSSALGNFVGNQLYGSQITSLQREIRIDEHTVDHLANKIGSQIEKAVTPLAHRPINVMVGKQVIARVTAEGAKKNSRRA